MLGFIATFGTFRQELHRELSGHWVLTLFLVSISVITVLLSIKTLRKLSRTVSTEATEVFESEA